MGSIRTLVLLVLVGMLGSSGAAAAAPVTDGGWVRLAHLSPDTLAVDVVLVPVSGADPALTLSGVEYGDVSGYSRVPAGTYRATMTPAGSAAGTTPVLTGEFEVDGGLAYTAAAVGLQAGLSIVVVDDELTPPDPGQARIRLLQASVSHPAVTISAVDGPVLARDAAFPAVTGYVQIPAGVWSLRVDADGAEVGTATGVRVEPGTINTLVVLDAPDGSVTVTALQDAAAADITPTGGVETGAGGTQDAGGSPGVVVVLLAVVLVGVPAGLRVLRGRAA